MYIFVNDDGLVHTNSNIKHVKCFSEYGLKYNNINFKSINNDDIPTDNDILYFKDFLLLPMTHISNPWHLIHHIYMLYKFKIKNNNSVGDFYYLFFNSRMMKRQKRFIKSAL